jgi:glycerol-3-phosphate dehydrogenase (NAD(P)+)
MSSKNNIGVIGAGKWGSALHHCFLVGFNSVISSRTKKDIKNFVSFDEVFEKEYIVLSIASQSIRGFLEQNSNKLKGKKLLVASKGIESTTGKFLNEVFEEFLDKNEIAYLSGPSFATEVMKNKPTALVINSFNENLAKEFEPFFPDFIKTYTSTDVIGAEISGAYKNVLAIASGICDGMELGNNARASLISRGLVEMERFGTFFEAKKDTFLGLSGAGDLFLSASSPLSRNYRVGFALSQEKTLEQILQELGEVAEGVETSKAIQKLTVKHDIYTPIANEVFQIINGKNCKKSLSDLLKH